MLTPHRTMRQNLKAKFEVFLVTALLLLLTTSAQAALFRVGPNDVPSPPGNGFPLWYQDTSALALDLCLPQNQVQLEAGVCLITTPANDPLAGMELPIVFPTNFPGEAFWWYGEALGDMNANGDQALLVMGLEAAFAAEDPVPGDQVSFGRIRIRIDAPVAGTYTVTHPYGVKVYPNVQPGRRAINDTSDIGIGSPGDFSGALQSSLGPFLRAANSAGGLALPNVTLPGDPSGDEFLSTAGAPVFVTGSPHNTNYFEVCVSPGTLDGVNACKRFEQFTLVGKVHTEPIASPLVLNRVTYARSGATAQVNVSATASPGPGALTPQLFFGDAAGTKLMPSTLMNGPTDLGLYYGQSIPLSAAALPASVIVTNTADNPPSSITQTLVDAVKIAQAAYNTATGRLNIIATTSDKGNGPAAPPQLVALGLPGSATGADAFTPFPTDADPARQQLIYTLPAGVPQVAPLTITVTSAAGGQDTANITAYQPGGTFAAGGPIAIDDSASTRVTGTGLFIGIPVFANDADFVRNTARIVSQGKKGTATVDPVTGAVRYNFIGPREVGTDSFVYTVKNAAGLESNMATVVVTVTP